MGTSALSYGKIEGFGPDEFYYRFLDEDYCRWVFEIAMRRNKDKTNHWTFTDGWNAHKTFMGHYSGSHGELLVSDLLGVPFDIKFYKERGNSAPDLFIDQISFEVKTTNGSHMKNNGLLPHLKLKPKEKIKADYYISCWFHDSMFDLPIIVAHGWARGEDFKNCERRQYDRKQAPRRIIRSPHPMNELFDIIF